MKINGMPITASKFAFDGCHKIYLIETPEEEARLEGLGYNILPIKDLQETYEDSCSLRFISDSALTTEFARQFEDAVFDH